MTGSAPSLAGKGAKIILLPEKVIIVTDTSHTRIHKALSDSSRKLGVTIIAGVARA
jgi:hypothetical protein